LLALSTQAQHQRGEGARRQLGQRVLWQREGARQEASLPRDGLLELAEAD